MMTASTFGIAEMARLPRALAAGYRDYARKKAGLSWGKALLSLHRVKSPNRRWGLPRLRPSFALHHLAERMTKFKFVKKAALRPDGSHPSSPTLQSNREKISRDAEIAFRAFRNFSYPDGPSSIMERKGLNVLSCGAIRFNRMVNNGLGHIDDAFPGAQESPAVLRILSTQQIVDPVEVASIWTVLLDDRFAQGHVCADDRRLA